MKIAILGGGISGLSAAWYARKKYPVAKIELFEKTNRLGGWIETEKQGPFLFEKGPRTFQTARSPFLLKLIDELELTPNLLFSSHKNQRYLLKKGKLYSIASHWPTILQGILRDLLMPKGNRQEETIADFFTFRFGKKFTEELIDPLVTGIFGGDLKKLSLEASFPKIADYKQKGRSLIVQLLKTKKQTSSLFTLKGGMQTMIEPLRAAIDQIHFGTHLFSLPDADLVISALPADEIARLTKIPLSIRYEDLVVVNVGFQKEVLPIPGYGYLIPSKEKQPVLGMIWDSSIFEVKGQTVMTAMVRSNFAELETLSALKNHLKIDQKPEILLTRKAFIPQYDLFHHQNIERFQKEAAKKYPNLKVLGNWIKGPAVEDCIHLSNSI